MPVTIPYAQGVAIVRVIQAQRDGNLPDPVTPRGLVPVGVSKGMESRTLAALRFLALIDRTGAHTPLLTEIRYADDAEWPNVLASAIKRAYAPLFQQIPDIAKVTKRELDDAFKQQFGDSPLFARQLSLFRVLCRATGLLDGDIADAQPTVQEAEPVSTATGVGGSVMQDKGGEVERRYPTLFDHLRELPISGKWTRAKHAKWLQALTGLVDWAIDEEDPVDQRSDSMSNGVAHPTTTEQVFVRQ